MELVLNQPGMEPFEPAKDLNVVIACEDPAIAGHACAVLERIGRKNKAEGRLIYRWWNFEVLAIAALQKVAVSEAVAADMIVIAARDGKRLPKAVNDWMRQWLATGEHHRRGLLAVLVTDPDMPRGSENMLSRHKKVAAEGRMDFFAKRLEGDLGMGLTKSGSTARQFVMTRKRARKTDCRANKSAAGVKSRRKPTSQKTNNTNNIDYECNK
jgi:hypothetical protein